MIIWRWHASYFFNTNLKIANTSRKQIKWKRKGINPRDDVKEAGVVPGSNKNKEKGTRNGRTRRRIYILYWSGGDSTKRGAQGVEIMVKSGQIKNIVNNKYINARILKID